MRKLCLIIIFTLGLNLGFNNVFLSQGAEFDPISRSKSFSITTADKYYGSDDSATKTFFAGEVDSLNNWTIVNVTVTSLDSQAPLKLYVDYWLYDKNGVVGIPSDATSNGTLDPYNLGRSIQEGDKFDFAFNWTTWSDEYIYPTHEMSIEVETTNGSDFTGSVSVEVAYTLNGKESKDKDSIGFEWLIGFSAIISIAICSIKSRYRKKN